MAAAKQTRAETLGKLHLKTVEHHGQPARQLIFNTVDADKLNLFATVASNQATVYDNEHFGSYVAVVEQFVNAATEYTTGGELLACCWLSSAGTPQPHGDALLAVGGADNAVSLISLSAAAVFALLKGHTQAVIDLASTAARPHLLASVSKDGTVRVWDVAAEACAATLASPTATCVSFREDGAAVFVGTSSGAVLEWALPAKALKPGSAPAPDAAPAAEPPVTPASAATAFAGTPAAHGSRVDCVSVLRGGRVASKSADGRVVVWDAAGGAAAARQLAGWKVPGCSAGDKVHGRFGATPDGAVLVAGSASGEVFAFDAASGAKLSQFTSGKARAAVLACAVADDCSTLLAALANGCIARWELVVPTDAPAGADDMEAAAE